MPNPLPSYQKECYNHSYRRKRKPSVPKSGSVVQTAVGAMALSLSLLEAESFNKSFERGCGRLHIACRSTRNAGVVPECAVKGHRQRRCQAESMMCWISLCRLRWSLRDNEKH
ncbi:unnamed protein product [Ixodes pacificus]